MLFVEQVNQSRLKHSSLGILYTKLFLPLLSELDSTAVLNNKKLGVNNVKKIS